ncbi:unnamed protein product, partial [Porites evermanni]
VVKALGVWYVFYFVITIFFCSFYLLNLVLAVVYMSYEKEMESIEQEERRKELMRKTAASYTADSSTLKNLRPLRKLRKTKEAMVEVAQTACIVTDVPDIENEHKRNQKTLVERVCECFRFVKTTCENCLSRIPFLKSLRKRMRTVAECAAFDAVIIGVIMLNTIVLALYHHGIEKKFEKVLDLCNMV